MHACLDDLVIALYVTIDELLGPRLGPGHPPKLSDAELVTLAVAQVLLGARSERHWLRFVRARLGHLFPYLPGQAATTSACVPLATSSAWPSGTWPWWRRRGAMDYGCWTPPHCRVAPRGRPSSARRCGQAAYGHDRRHSRWYWGFKLYLLCAPDGMPIIWCLATPRLGEREVAQVLLEDADRQQALAAGTIILADKGFAGRAFEQVVGELGAFLVRPDRKDEPRRFGPLGGMRQWTDSVVSTLKDQLGLERHGGRTLEGVFVRTGQRLLALAPAVGQLAARPARQALPAGL